MFACRNLYYEFFDIFITDQNQYLRVMVRELSDIRAEQRDLRRLIIAKKSEVRNNNSEGNRHLVFQRHVSLPLNTKEDFLHFEKELIQPEVNNNLESSKKCGKRAMGFHHTDF
jgi:hypothetical protein